MRSFLLFFVFFILLFSTSLAVPTAFLIPIINEPSTHQYTTIIHHKSPLKPTTLLLDLSSSFLFVNCKRKYLSSSPYQLIPCYSPLCTSITTSTCPTCVHNCTSTCTLFLQHPLTQTPTVTATALRDSLALPTTDGRNPGHPAPISDFIFACSRAALLKKGLAKGATGLLPLGRSNFSLPAQISTALSSPYLFSLCLSGSPSAPGVAFFGTRGPYIFLPEVDLSNSLNYTPLLENTTEYLINVRSVNINGKALSLQISPLTAKISTTTTYTTMETSIYKSFTEAFIKEATDSMHLSVTKPVKPFHVCYSSDDVESTKVGPAVPTVDLVMENDDVMWRIYGLNSMVRVKDVWCLGFVDGGYKADTSIVIGGFQMDDNLVQFDMEQKKFGFSSSLLMKNTTCANFNFTMNG